MASVAENLSILQSVFAPAANSLSEYNRGRLALAQSNIRRAQELQDQQTASNLQRELNNARIGADDRRTEMAIRKQQLADDARFRQAMAVTNEAEERQLAKLKADEAKATRAAVRKLYQEYSDAGGKKKLSEFGAEDSIDTFYALQGEVSPLARKNSLDAFAGQARLLREQEKALKDSINLSSTEEAEIVGGSLQALMTDERAADGVEFYNNAIAKGRSPEAALDAMRKKYPGAGQALDAMVSSLRSAKIAEKTSTPGFKIGVEQIGRLRSDLAKRAWDERLPSESFGMLFEQAPVSTPTPAPAGGALGTFAPPKPSPVQYATAPAEQGYGGIRALARMIPNAVDQVRLSATSPFSPITGLSNLGAYVWGGERGLREAQAERSDEASAIMALLQARNRTPVSPYADIVPAKSPLAAYVESRRLGTQAPTPLVFQ